MLFVAGLIQYTKYREIQIYVFAVIEPITMNITQTVLHDHGDLIGDQRQREPKGNATCIIDTMSTEPPD